MKSWIKKFGGWLPIVIVLVSVTQKLCYIDSLASSGDDNLVATSILYGKMPFNESKVRITINDKTKPTYFSYSKKIARKLDSTGFLMPTMRTLHFLFPFYAVPNETTYAPLQFLFTAFLVRDSQSFFTNIVMGRLPSLLVHSFGLLLFLYLMVKYFNGSNNLFALCYCLSILSFSFENVLYSLQMESYSIGVFGVFLLIFFYLRYLEKDLSNQKSSYISIGLICSILMLMQYQLIFFSFAAVCGIIFFSLNRKVPFVILAKRIIFSGLIFLTFFIPIYILFLNKHTNHVAEHLVGDTQALKYWFPSHLITGFKDGVFYFFKFFSSNLVEVFRVMTLTFPAFTMFEKISFLFNISLLFAGLFYLIKSRKDQTIYSFIIFLFFTVFVWGVLIVIGLFALTPDRHSLIFLPVFAIVEYFGCVFLISKIINAKNRFINKTEIIVIVVFSLIFLVSVNEFLRNRIEPLFIANFNEKTIPPNSLIISSDRVIYLFSKKKNYVPIYLQVRDSSRRGWLVTPKENIFLPKRIYFLMRFEKYHILSPKDLPKNIEDALNSFKVLVEELPLEIRDGNKDLNDLFIKNSYKQILNKEYSVIDDEVYPKFYRERFLRLVILEKV